MCSLGPVMQGSLGKVGSVAESVTLRGPGLLQTTQVLGSHLVAKPYCSVCSGTFGEIAAYCMADWDILIKLKFGFNVQKGNWCKQMRNSVCCSLHCSREMIDPQPGDNSR